jgi:hemolysin-activating ACP:hemolysin acyltransferase
VDTTLTDRVVALETKLNTAALFEKNTTVQTDFTPAQIVEAMNNAEWLWEKVNNYVDASIEQAIDDHCSTYDHDQYDEVYNEWGGESPDNFLKDEYVDDQIEEKVKEVLNNATFSISI